MRFYDYFEISQHVEVILTVFGLFDLYGRSIRSNFSYFLINDFFLIAILCILIFFCNFDMFYDSFSRRFYTSQS